MTLTKIYSKLIKNNLFLRILNKYKLKNLISEPTRITSTSATCLDLILTNHCTIINNTEIVAPFQSDHCTISAEIAFKTYRIQSQKKTIWKYDEADIDAIKTKLRNVIWSFIQNLSDINEINSKFTKIIIDTASEAIPKMKFFNRFNDKPWMNNDIRKHMRQRNRLYKKMKRCNNETDV